MIKLFNATTEEIDEPEEAVQEILDALDLKNNLMKNSVGIVTCYAEFLETGVVELLAKSLPFEIVGTTTMQNAVDGSSGRLLLTLSVLTSDDAVFSTALSDSIFDQREKPIADMYNDALKKLGTKPTMMLSFVPLINHVGGDEILKAIDKVSNGLPNFGTMTVDHNLDYHQANIIYNDKYNRTSMAVILIGGEVRADFSVVSISDKKIQKQRAIITDSAGSLLKEVNGINIASYLRSLGLMLDKGIEGANVIPFVIDYNDGTHPVARAIFAITDEGYAVCGGEMPIGATLAIGSIDYEDVVKTAKEAVSRVIDEEEDISGLIMFSCIARNLVLGADSFAEMVAVEAAVSGRVPYLLCYSGGEICPVYNVDKKEVNRFHNDTLVICKLY